ncbi:hypothetical protein MMC13_003702 [Lambiella insularis]|nr:hypothetical protein [Lambiella insularis]
MTSKATLLSPTDGNAMVPQSLQSLLSAAVRAILRECLASDDILPSIRDSLQPEAAQSCTIISIGTSSGSKLVSMIRDHNETADVTLVNEKAIMNGLSESKYVRQSKLAITGFSGRFPEAENIHQFWDMLRGGIDTHSETPANRWDVKTHVDPTLKRKNTSATPWGCWLNNPGLFDRSFFSISPREAPQMDPAQRIALMCAYEALEMAGIVPDSTPSTMRSRVGVFIGATSNDWCETNSAQDVDFYFIPGGNRAFIPGRINYFFKFSGPSFSVDTACSSSLAATHMACNALWRNEIDTAIIGGTNVMTNPDVTAGLDRGHFLSRTGNCKSFDDGADGYCRGEGVGIVVLKRLEDAQAENDTIYGCILAALTNHSAEAESITRPHVGAQQALFSQVLANAGVHPNDVDYVEMHGTGTQAGDSGEMSSVSQTFAQWPPGDPRGRDSDLYVGSVKANVGHGESVAGVTALIKILLMLQKNEIPPHCGIKTKINRSFPLDLHERRIQIARQPVPWARTTKPRRVVVNNFSAAGGNSCVVVEEAPMRPTEGKREDSRFAHVVAMSGKTPTALEANLRSLTQFLLKSETVSLPDVAYTSTARRLHYNFRASYAAQNIQELTKALEQDLASMPKQYRGPPRMVYTFSGQGSSCAGMGKLLYDTNATFRKDLNRFDAIVQDQGFGSILPYIRGEQTAQQSSPLTAQLSHVSVQMALAQLWKSWGIIPAAVLGHSLGEYAALHCAGVLSDFDVLSICGHRAKLLATHCQEGTHAMLVVRCAHHEVVTSLANVAIEVACINGPRETVISGSDKDITAASQQLDSLGIKCNRIPLPFAFHSSQLQPIMGHFARVLEAITLRSPAVPVLSPLLSKVIEVGDIIDPDYLLRQCRETVNLVGAVQAAQDSNIFDHRTHVLEIGPSLVLARLVQRNIEMPLTLMQSLEPNQDPWMVLSRGIATAYRVGCNVNWAQYYRDYDHSVIQLPSYSWDLKTYWMQYVNDWSLRKGEALPAITAASTDSRFKIDTTCCQKIVSVQFDGEQLHAVVESDLQSKSLKPLVAGHRVNGIAVCVGSVYADMAQSCAKSALKCFQDDASNIALVLKDMDMQESIIISDTAETQLVRMGVHCIWQQRKVEVEIKSADSKGQFNKIHAKATVVFADRKQEQQMLEQNMGTIGSQIESLKNNVASGQTERFSMSMAYRMVASLAHYDGSHKGCRECFLDSTSFEGVATIALAPENRLAGEFSLHPCVFDSILQLATFVLNANENSRFDQEVYVVRGWDSVFLTEVLQVEEKYTTYVKMTARDKDVSAGDIAITKEGSIIGCIKGVRVSRVPRRLMDVMFKPPGAASNNTKTTALSQLETKEVQLPNITKGRTDSSRVNKALGIISEESCIALPELKDEDLLSSIGIDSLLILVIASRFREELQLDLQPTFFAEVSSIGAIRAFFDAETPSSSSESGEDTGSATPDRLTSSTRASSVSDEGGRSPTKDQPVPVKKAPVSTSVVLQGTLHANTKTIFLFPDGSGSATSYMNFPRIHEDIAVIAMNCPYMTKPQEMEGTFEEITRILLAEVRRRQPHGPYYLGGWSAGGAHAFYATQVLLAAGEEVKALVLIDAPCPIGLGKLPQAFFDFWRNIHQPGQMMGDRPLPPWLMDHFKAVNENLRGYNAVPLPHGKSPKTYLAWAAQGTDNLAGFNGRHLLTEAENADLGFLMDNKTDFGPRGWETLLEDEIIIERAMTSNHFTIVRGDGAALLAGLIKRACLTQD